MVVDGDAPRPLRLRLSIRPAFQAAGVSNTQRVLVFHHEGMPDRSSFLSLLVTILKSSQRDHSTRSGLHRAERFRGPSRVPDLLKRTDNRSMPPSAGSIETESPISLLSAPLPRATAAISWLSAFPTTDSSQMPVDSSHRPSTKPPTA